MELKDQLEAALGSNFRITHELGGGGMSRVFLTEDIEHGRDIVVKVVPAELAGQVNLERFRREIKVAAKLQHPCIVPVLSSGSAGDLPYYTMPFVEGESLRSRLTRERGLSVQESLRILRDISGAVAYAHEHGILHRDIKPENILVTKHHAVLADFGVAKALSDSTVSSSPLTSVGVALGTPAYMAPEQAAADPSTDHRADIYALGVVAYEMLAGRHPFEGRSSQSMLAAHAIETPNSVTVHRPNLPAPIASLIMRMMEKHPGDRPQSAEEVLTALDQVTTPAETISAAAPRARSNAGSELRKRRLIITGAAAGALLTIAAISLFAFRGGFKSVPLSDSDVLVLEPSSTGAAASISAADADRILDAVNRGLAEVSTAHLIATEQPSVSVPEKAAALGRSAGAANVITTSVYPLGDKLQIQFRLVDARTGDIVRTLAPVQVALNPSPAELDSAVNPLLTVVGFATSPLLGREAIPLKEIPPFAAFKEFETAVSASITPDPITAAASLKHITSSIAQDSNFIQAQLWRMWMLRSNGMVRNIPLSAYQYDTLQAYVLDKRPSMSPFEATLADFVFDRLATERGIQALRKLYATNPHNPMRRDLPIMLGDLNRPFAADSTLKEFLVADTSLNSSVYYWLSRAYFGHYVGNYKQTLEAAQRAREIAPGDVATLRAELVALAALGDTAAISQRLAMVAVATRNRNWFDFAGDLYLSTAQELWAHGYKEAGDKTLAKTIDWFDKRTEEDWKNSNVALRGAIAYSVVNRIGDAEKLVLPLMQKFPHDNRYRGLYGRLLAQKGDTAGALRVAAEIAALPREKISGTPAFERAQIMAQLGRRDEAVALLQEAFGQGVGFASYRSRIHIFPVFTKMKGYPPYDALITPQG